jgi:hypothetical protein
VPTLRFNKLFTSAILLSATALLSAPLAGRGQIVTKFQDNFTSSTLNPTASSPGTVSSSQTAYEIASSKSATSTTIASGTMTYGNFSTSSGYCEGQALFTGSPITLNTPGQYIEIYYVFTDTTTLFNGNGGANEEVNIGLYNSGGVAPTNGTSLWNSGLSSGSTAGDVGCTKGWVGYTSEFSYNNNSSAMASRAAQTAANNLNQGLGYNSGATTANLTTMGAVAAEPVLTVGNQYTMDLKIMYINATTMAITNTLYSGVGNSGSIVSEGGWTGLFGTQVSNPLTFTYDGMCVGFRPTSNPTTAETMKINNVTVLLGTPIAPNITGLINQTIVQGSNAVLNPTITGVPAPTYQWYVSTDGGVTSNAVSSATSPSLTLTNVQYSQNNYIYSVVAANSLGTNSESMTLSVIVPPSITGLNNQAAQVGSLITISPTVAGVPAPTFQWQTNGVNLADGPDANGSIIAGSSTDTLDITNAQVGDTATYFLIASNSAGITTNSMTLTIASGNLLPELTGPTNITVIQGNNATFSASAIGVPVPTYQWLDQTQTPIPGQTSGTLTLTDVQYSQNGFQYYFVASNAAGSVTNDATLTVIVTPAITTQPASLVVTNTQAASFTVVAGGVPAPAYQWYFNSNAIPASANSSATSATLSFAHAAPTNSGTYYVVITNAAGATTSASVTLTVNSTMGATTLSPVNGATGICYDTPFYITFSSPVVENKTGKIRIYNVNNSTTPVDTIDLSQNAATGVQTRTPFPGDGQSFNYFPVIISNNVAGIYPHASSGIMTSNQSYYVSIDDGAFTDTNGAYFAGITPNTWQFATKVGGPANPTNLVVAQNNSGDFVTVQGAVDSIPLNNLNPTLINIKNGLYNEIVDIASKQFVTFRGQSRGATVVGYLNNANLAPGGTTHARMAFKVDASNVSVENMTITNMTPQGGSQAEALMIESGASRFILNNAEVDSRQDTILANVNTSQGYFYNSLITGNFDYIWGGGNLFFTNCQIRTITGTANCNLAAPRTDNGATGNWPGYSGLLVSNGFSFVECQLSFQSGAGLCTMSDANGSANGLAAWIDCSIDTNCFTNATVGVQTTQLLWESGCSNINNTVALNNAGSPFLGFTQLNNGDPRLTAADSATIWLNGWVPALAPNIVSQPANVNVSGGQSASFSVGATGIPDPGYQWLDNGVPISGANSATYNISSADATNAGSYSVVVSNGSGSVTSLVATLTYVLPVANTATYTRYAGYPLGISVTNLLSYVTDANITELALVGTGVSTNGVTLADSSNFLQYQNANNVNDQFAYTVTDGFGGTNSGLVNVVINNSSPFGPSSPVITATNNVTTILYSGIPGYSYSVSRTTNLLTGWTTIWTTNMPVGGVFQFKDTNPPQPEAYYQLLWNWY